MFLRKEEVIYRGLGTMRDVQPLPAGYDVPGQSLIKGSEVYRDPHCIVVSTIHDHIVGDLETFPRFALKSLDCKCIFRCGLEVHTLQLKPNLRPDST